MEASKTATTRANNPWQVALQQFEQRAVKPLLISDAEIREFAKATLMASGMGGSTINNQQRTLDEEVEDHTRTDAKQASHTHDSSAFTSDGIEVQLLLTSGSGLSTEEEDADDDETEALDEDKEDDCRRMGDKSHIRRNRWDSHSRRRDGQYLPTPFRTTHEEHSPVAHENDHCDHHRVHPGRHR